MRSGKDQLVSGAVLTLGIVPVGVTVADDSTGLGKVITFNDGGTTPTDNYRVVISAREEVITNVEDPFIKSANLAESTAQKIRLNFRLNIVSTSDQTETPVPYTNDNTDENLVNQITVSPSALFLPPADLVTAVSYTFTFAGPGTLTLSMVGHTPITGLSLTVGANTLILLVFPSDPGILPIWNWELFGVLTT